MGGAGVGPMGSNVGLLASSSHSGAFGGSQASSNVGCDNRPFQTSSQSLQNGGNINNYGGKGERKNSYPGGGGDCSPRSQRSLHGAVVNMQRQNSNESTGKMSAYGIRIQGIQQQQQQQRTRLPSDESSVGTVATKATMTPPSSLSRKRKDSSTHVHGLVRNNSSAAMLAPPSDPNQNRMASPDLPLVHYQRAVGTSGCSQQQQEGTVSGGFATKNILTQSQILNPDAGNAAHADQDGVRNPQQQESPSQSGNVLLPTTTNVTRRSSTQTPSSNRSSIETVGSVISVHVLDSPNQTINKTENQTYCNTPPRNKNMASPHLNNSNSFIGGNLPKIEESNRESRSFSSKDSLDELENRSKGGSNRVSRSSRDFEATGTEIAEVDYMLRELGCSAGNDGSRRNQQRNSGVFVESNNVTNGNTQITNNVHYHQSKPHDKTKLNNLNARSSPTKNNFNKNGKQNHKQRNVLGVRDSSSPSDDNNTYGKSKTMSSDHGTQISEYENDDHLVQASPVSTVQVKNAPKISLVQQQKRNSFTNSEGEAFTSVTKDSGCQTKSFNQTSSSNDSDLSKAQSISTQTNLTAPVTHGSQQQQKVNKKDLPYRPMYSNKRLMSSFNDDSSSTSSSIYGIPKMSGYHRVKVEPPEEDSPPPLPPPPSEEAMMSLERRMNEAVERQRRGYENVQQVLPPSGQPTHVYHHHYPPLYRQPLFGNSAFRPVPPTRGGQYYQPMMGHRPVIRGPNLGFVGVGRGASGRGLRPFGMKSSGAGGAPYRMMSKQFMMKQYGPPSSNTSEENASIFVPRRKPSKQQEIASRQSQTAAASVAEKNKQSKATKSSSSSGSGSKNSPSEKKQKINNKPKQRHHSDGNQIEEPPSASDAPAGNDQDGENKNGSPKTGTGSGSGGEQRKLLRPAAPPFQIKRRQPHQQPIRKCRSLDYIPSDLDESLSVSSRAESPSCEYTTNGNNSAAYMPITELIKNHIIGPDNISLSSLESGSEMSRSEPDLNYDSSTTAYESEYDNYRPGMASDEDYFVPEPVSDVELGMFDDIDLEDVTVSDQYNIDMVDLMSSSGKVVINDKHTMSDV